MSLGVEIMSFLKEERGGLPTNRWNHWNLVLEKGSEETQLLMSRWIRALVGASESTQTLGGILKMTAPNTFLGAVP
jgi:hypothetical protein